MGFGHKFSLDNFKKWMKEHHDEVHVMGRPDSLTPLGKYMKPKIGVNRLVQHMDSDISNLEEMAIEFKESGGRVVDIEGEEFVIEVNAGCFKINRMFLKKSS